MSGCAGGTGPETMTIDAARYNAGFDAAVDAARALGLAAGLRDRRAGVIETEPALAASLLEPWRADNATFEQAMQNTIALQRRRARFEFVPAGRAPVAPAGSTPGDSGAAILPGRTELSPDLTQHQGRLELRVSVVVERSYQPGIRHNNWTRSGTTTSSVIAADAADQLPSQFWTPVTRDQAMERRLLAAIEAALRD